VASESSARDRPNPHPPTARLPRRSGVGNLHYRFAAVLIVVLVVGAGLLYGLESTHRPIASTPTPNASSVNLPTPIRHLIIIFLENHARVETLANGTFERYLAGHYASAANFHGMTYDSLQDYMYATSGAFSPAVSSVPQLIDRAGETWAAYMQSMPVPCDRNASSNGLYTPNHDPFVQYDYVTASASYCASHVLPLTDWYDAVANGTLPNYVFVTPNILNDSYNSSVIFADQFLQGFLDPFLNSTLFASSAVIVTYDSNAQENPPPGTPGSGVVYFAAVSPFAHRDFTSNAFYNDNSLLTTTEWLLGLGRTNHNDNWAIDPPMVDLFDFAQTYSLSGTVTYQGNPVTGAIVSGSGYAVSTNASGGFSIPMPNGTYQLNAASGLCASSPTLITVAGSSTGANFALPCV
jgi:acid phosphatase